MISPRSRALLDRYALASRALSQETGERLASEAGQSVEFHDFRPYDAGDELRYVDWKVYRAHRQALYPALPGGAYHRGIRGARHQPQHVAGSQGRGTRGSWRGS